MSAALLAMLVGSGASAADDEIFFAELPVVASASRLPQRMQDAPTAMTILDRDLIRASGARDFNDLFRLVPGFQTFPNTTDPTRVTYHGLTDEDFSPRLQVLVDGRSLYSPLFRSGVNWNLLPVTLEDVERIEVIRGTNSAAYGSNAFLGVVNIITVDPAVSRGTSLLVRHGDRGVRDVQLRQGLALGDAGHLRFSYQQQDDAALRDGPDWRDSLRRRLFNVRADVQVSDADVVQLDFGQAQASLPQGKIGSLGEPAHEFSQQNAYLHALWRRALANAGEFQLRYAWSRDSARDAFLAATGPNPADLLYWDGSFFGNSIRHEVEAQHTFSPGRDMRLAWGAGLRRDVVQSGANFWGSPRLGRNIERLFGNLEWRPSHWFSGNLGASLEHDSLAGSHAAPRASANFHLDEENTVRFGAARAVRTGSMVDYLGDRRLLAVAQQDGTPIPASALLYDRMFYGNRGMPAERQQSVEVAYLGEWRAKRLSLDVRLFHERIPNRLLQVARTVNDAALCELGSCGSFTADFTTPIQDVRIRGLEYQLRWQPAEPTRLLLSQALTRISARFTGQFLNDSSVVVSGQDLAGWQALTERSAPQLASAFMLMQQLPRSLDFSLAAYRQGAMKWTRHSEAAAYQRIDARLASTFRLGQHKAELAYTVQSLNGAHGEFRADGGASDRIVERRQWVSLRLEY